jgi:PhnB protein
MAAKVNPVPEGLHTVTPYLCVHGAVEAIRFYEKAFGAKEKVRFQTPDGKIRHAEIEIGDSRVLLSDEFPEMPNALIASPSVLNGSSVCLQIYVPDADSLFARAVAAGAEVRRGLQDMFFGDRSGAVEDPFGHIWTLSTHIEEVTPEEAVRRMAGKAKAV